MKPPNIPWGKRFVLWRHDCDLSLNRAYALAKIESEEGVSATYFLNPHCEFYNLFEKEQHRLVLAIIEMGHEIGLHFDAAFHDISDEGELDEQVRNEARLLEGLYGVKPAAFSFHNPVAAHLNCEAETYGGLINCYSRRFKTNVPYCSDSNGYWRFRRLQDVLVDATVPCLQALTHPDWWQDNVMPPRQRIFRSVYGRAQSLMRRNDELLAAFERTNYAGAAGMLRFMKEAYPPLFEMYDYLWNSGQLRLLFSELWHLHECQIKKICKAELLKHWLVPSTEVNDFFESSLFAFDGWVLLTGVFGSSWQSTLRVDASVYRTFLNLRNTVAHTCLPVDEKKLEEGCVFLCKAIEALAAWGKSQPMAFDGISSLGSIDIETCKTADVIPSDQLEGAAKEAGFFLKKRWQQFKAKMQEIEIGEMVE